MPDPYRFAALGPFVVPTKLRYRRRVVDFDHARDYVFEQAAEQARKKLRISNIEEAVGCYIFALKPSGGKEVWPYYVGQACRQTLHQRLFQKSDKPEKYNDIMGEYKKARVYVYLFPLLTAAGNLAKLGANQKLINSAEFALIGMALQVNYDLWNVKHRVGMERFTIDGTPQSNRRDTDPAKSVRALLGFAEKSKVAGEVRGRVIPIEQTETLLEAEQAAAAIAAETKAEDLGDEQASEAGQQPD